MSLLTPLPILALTLASQLVFPLPARAMGTESGHGREAGVMTDGEDVMVVTGTRTPRPLAESPVSVQVMGRREIEEAGDATVADSLARFNGVIVGHGVRG